MLFRDALFVARASMKRPYRRRNGKGWVSGFASRGCMIAWTVALVFEEPVPLESTLVFIFEVMPGDSRRMTACPRELCV